MKAAVYHSQQDIRIEEMPKPEIGEDEILVEMKACGICGSDLMDWYLKTQAPLVLGHEPAGVIVKARSKVRDFKVGDRVFVHHHVACLTCHYCTHGDFTLCERFHRTNRARRVRRVLLCSSPEPSDRHIKDSGKALF